MKKIYYIYIILFCFVWVNPARAQIKHSFRIDSLNKLLSAQKTLKDSVEIAQQLADNSVTIDNLDEFTSQYIDKFLKLNQRAKQVDPAAYLLLKDAAKLNQAKQYRQELTALISAVHEFDKQHKIINPLLFYIRLLFNQLNDSEGKFNFYQQQLTYYQVNGPVENTAACYHGLGGYYLYKGAYNQSISNYLKAADVFRKFSPSSYAVEMSVVGAIYDIWGNRERALYYLEIISRPLVEKFADSTDIGYNIYSISATYYFMGRYEKTIKTIDSAIQYDNRRPEILATYYSLKANAYLKLHQPDEALPLLKRIKTIADSGSYQIVNSTGLVEVDYGYYLYYRETGKNDLAEKSLLTAYHKANDYDFTELKLKYLQELGDFYKAVDKGAQAADYYDRYFKLNASIEKGLDKYKMAQYEIDQNDRQQQEHINQLKQEKVLQDYQLSRRNSLLWASLVVLLFITGLLVFIYRQLSINKKTLASLRNTQKQLIQSEKMASLGELTAGIAHEIQNPLNFVNNFSEVNIELLQEMEAELKLGEYADALDISADVRQNMEKIQYHGKRADSIVKGMLQHSRATSDKKEPTDINLLADEYFRLAYHGLRAKNQAFNADLVTSFAPALPEIDMVPQDVGRVLLNLFNNAFYAVQKKKETAGPDFKPTVEIATSLYTPPSGARGVEIKVKDNGSGIPDAIKEKIMQPFFTTKPTGEGTGLGLSLSYDIIVKGHGGTINVESAENEYTLFTITLPIGDNIKV